MLVLHVDSIINLTHSSTDSNITSTDPRMTKDKLPAPDDIHYKRKDNLKFNQIGKPKLGNLKLPNIR